MIESVSRAMQILELLSDRPKGVTLTMAVTALSMEKSAVSRILATLQEQGYVVRDADSDMFRITLRFAGMALRHIERIGIVEACMPALQQLADATDELVQLAVISGGQSVYIAKAMGAQRVQALPLIGTSAELHASAAGKLWLASLDEEEALRLAIGRGLRKITSQTITTVGALRTELARIRKRGYASVQQELSEDMNAIAVPVLSAQSGELVAAVVLSAPAFRKRMAQLEEQGPLVQACAQQLAPVLSVYRQEALAASLELTQSLEK